jgi:hypothetical protein
MLSLETPPLPRAWLLYDYLASLPMVRIFLFVMTALGDSLGGIVESPQSSLLKTLVFSCTLDLWRLTVPDFLERPPSGT